MQSWLSCSYKVIESSFKSRPFASRSYVLSIVQYHRVKAHVTSSLVSFPASILPSSLPSKWMNFLNDVKTNGGLRWPSRDQRTPWHSVKILSKSYTPWALSDSSRCPRCHKRSVFLPYVKLTQCVSNLTGVNEHVLFFISIIIIIIIIVFFFAYKHDPVVKKLTFLSTHLQTVLIPGSSYFM